ncbi:thiol-disulfide isomerase/thioredoxin [Amycolatopsis bartoniae]|uniref:Thioredoxin domain-containing protein n=1 Tax=Amycolatopsis bartoniae TaxID=941986 RepID=A0A8H9IZH3_9PSEU|nr:TlpA disulfide reductase family protein [Amycolatopsis bartoniae]MBB2935195.1 thiol-disulfide isomerase/thioredoxin [Amycolatopsis bartoniae]TVS99375.1 TlpA family protein disulfide reductase [Amycolatopsis bartoniae]GHF75037.1 hypothetical protein GCM10017566_56130 [Amycolatopsis bartoniae]
MTKVTKWALAAGVLVLAVIVAVLPRTAGTRNTAGPDLTAARAAAALAPCPTTGSGKVAQLDGVSAQCLADGGNVDLSAVLAGHTTLVNVWATWCVPCKTELPVLAQYARQPGAVPVLLVQAASSQADGLALLKDLGVHLPSVFDGEGNTGPVREKLKVAALPSSYLVTPDGQVHLIRNPPTFGDPDAVRQAVESGS